MSEVQQEGLRTSLHPYTRRSTALALAIFGVDVLVYAAAVVGAVILENTVLKLACVLVAGAAISALFVIGHDAAHGSYTPSKRLNRVIGHIAFMPALHNFSLWQIAHNRLHHRRPNMKGLNSWSPLSKSEYDALSPAGKLLHRLYRSPGGLGLYYLIERWWKDKFYPTRRVVGKARAVYWWDFVLLLFFLAFLALALILTGSALANSSAWASLLWGFVLPFAMWNANTGFTVYLQHTHPHVPWFADEKDWRRLRGQEAVTVHVLFPRWYGIVSHHIMEHPVHHVNPKIPLYRLRQAQLTLGTLLGERLVTERFTIGGFLDTMARCKLYDYRNHRWLDFHGNPTSACTLSHDNIDERHFSGHVSAA